MDATPPTPQAMLASATATEQPSNCTASVDQQALRGQHNTFPALLPRGLCMMPNPSWVQLRAMLGSGKQQQPAQQL
jgi:hypothetical protein